MKKVSFGKLVSGILAGKQTAPAGLWRPAGKPYPRLLDLNPLAEGLNGQEGIYAIWHLGVRPQWLRVGSTANLGVALTALAKMPWIAFHENNAGVFTAWASPPPDQCPGIVAFLAEKLRPAFQAEVFEADRALDSAVVAISCALPPGTR